MVHLHSQRRKLIRHEIDRCAGVPRLEGITGIGREVWRSAEGGCAVNWRNEHEIATRIVDGAAAEGKRRVIVVEPIPVVEHEAEEALLRICAAGAAHAAAVLAPCIDS